MKTLTIKSAQNVPIHSSYIVEVDGEKIGLMKAGETKYFDIAENTATLMVRMQGAKSNSVDISENTHHSLIINSKKQILNSLLFTLSFFAISFAINYYVRLQLEYLVMIQIVLAFLIYTVYKKTKFNNLQLSLLKNI